ncbi:MAG: tetratricopeptide repeat protein [Candidatus Omnitrophota bacterium]|nr:tetratricopeptide repeat protein [Candidatus Omnitrophota bacterium]
METKRSGAIIFLLVLVLYYFPTFILAEENIKNTANSAQDYIKRGILYGKEGQYDQAISELNKAIELNPNNAIAYASRDLAYEMKGDINKAISDYSKAIEISSNFAVAYYNRGVAYFLMKKYDESWADVHKAEALGYRVNAEFLKNLKKESGKER